MFRFYGLIDFIRLSLRFVGAKLRKESISALAQESGIKVVPAKSVNDAQYLQTAEVLAPDVIVSVAAPEIFRPRNSRSSSNQVHQHSQRKASCLQRHDAKLLAITSWGIACNNYGA